MHDKLCTLLDILLGFLIMFLLCQLHAWNRLLVSGKEISRGPYHVLKTRWYPLTKDATCVLKVVSSLNVLCYSRGQNQVPVRLTRWELLHRTATQTQNHIIMRTVHTGTSSSYVGGATPIFDHILNMHSINHVKWVIALSMMRARASLVGLVFFVPFRF